MSDGLNLDQEDELDGSSNPGSGDDKDDEGKDLFEDELDEKEKERIALEVLNKRIGKDYKSMDDVVKSEKQRDKEFAINPPKKDKPTVKQNAMDPEEREALLLATYPELKNSPETMRELKELSELRGESMFSVYKKNTYFQNRAKEESSVQVDPNKEKPLAPTPAAVPPKSDIKPTDEDIRIANRFFGGDVQRYLKHKVPSNKSN